MGELISSPQNPHVKDLVRLRKDGEARREQGAFWLEGERATREAVAKGLALELVWSPNLAPDAQDLAERAERAGARVTRVGKDAFRKLADVRAPQGVGAVCRVPEADIDAALGAPGALALVAAGVQDPGNLGALVRTAAAAGAGCVVATPPTCDFYNAKAVRASAGSLLALPCARLDESELLALLEERGVRLVASVPRGGGDYRQADWSRPVALAVGSEAHGVPETLLAASAARVTIPIAEGVESLNAAAAAAILLFAARGT